LTKKIKNSLINQGGKNMPVKKKKVAKKVVKKKVAKKATKKTAKK